MQDKYILEMENITKNFPGSLALNKIDFKVRPGTVHALMGENGAGKSTLMKIIAGLYTPDEGARITFCGKRFPKNMTPHKAIEMGISTIHQELSPILDMTIAENIFLGHESSRFGFIQKKKHEAKAVELMNRVGVNYNPRMKMRSLPVAGMQMIEITKSIFKKSSLIIMDEPTSSLMDSEIEKLFNQIHELRKSGVAVIYISHKMEEIFKLADDITVLRDGEMVSTGPASEYSMEKLITQMVGRSIDTLYPKSGAKIGRVMLEAKGFNSKNKFQDISFKVREGEIVGFTGLVGAGRTEIMRALFGLDGHDSGEVYVDGSKVKIRTPKEAMKYGIAMVNEDRKLSGLVLCRSVKENISLPNLKQFVKAGLLRSKLEKQAVAKSIKQLGIKLSGMESGISSLSGGNQQKAVLAKWLMREVKVLILDEPTRGIDVAAKNEIYCIIGDLVNKGMAVVLISSELPEVMGISDRIIVMSRGKIACEVPRGEFNQEMLLEKSMAHL